MAIQKRTRKFATTKRIISQRDDRLKKNKPEAKEASQKKSDKSKELVRDMYVPRIPSSRHLSSQH